MVTKKKDFYFSNGTQGQLFLVTNLASLAPHWKKAIFDLIYSFLAIILITALLLVIWLYRSIAYPISILRIATIQIGAGNLDYPSIRYRRMKLVNYVRNSRKCVSA